MAEISKRICLPVAARWQIISSSVRPNSQVNKDRQNKGVQALHFECDVKDVPVVVLYLEFIYSSTRDGSYPLWVELRLIPLIDKVHNLRTRNKVAWLRNCQAGFDKHIYAL